MYIHTLWGLIMSPPLEHSPPLLYKQMEGGMRRGEGGKGVKEVVPPTPS